MKKILRNSHRPSKKNRRKTTRNINKINCSLFKYLGEVRRHLKKADKIGGERTHLLSLDGGGIRGLVLTTVLACERFSERDKLFRFSLRSRRLWAKTKYGMRSNSRRDLQQVSCLFYFFVVWKFLTLVPSLFSIAKHCIYIYISKYNQRRRYSRYRLITREIGR